MPDTKITALTAIGANPIIPATFPIPMVDLTDTSMAASGTTKKVTVNQILGAGGTATLASATITGDLTVDTSTLKVDSANNRVGIGTASPVASFQATLSGLYGLRIQSADTNNSALNIGNDPTSGYAFIDATKTGSGSFLPLRFSTSDTERYRIAADGVATWSNVGGVAGTAMTLNSTGLGVGVSPGSAIGNLQVGGSTNANLYTQQGTDTVRMGVRASGRTGIILDSSNATYTNRAWYLDNAGSSGSLVIGRQGLDVITFDNSGNVGISVTPSAWSTGKALEISAAGNALWSGTGYTSITQNTFQNSGYKYGYSGVGAARYDLESGTFKWHIAPSGTAGNAITFTQAMTLDASGNLFISKTATGLGTVGIQASPSGWLQATVSGDASLFTNRLASDGKTVQLYRETLEVGNISVTTTGATFNSTSDYRLKEAVAPLSGGLARVNALKPSVYKWKSNGLSGEGFLAHELADVVPAAVTGEKDAVNEDGSIKAQSIDMSRVVPILVAAIQELTARVQTLEAK
jgi:hypothetical protein